MATFKELMSGIKGLLKEKLNNDNLELFTQVDAELDKLSESHEKTESDLSSTKDKLVEMVKSTSFKDSEPENTHKADTDEPMDIDTALDEAINETISTRNKEEK